MLLLSLSLYVDFLLASGGARATVARAHLRDPFDTYSAFKASAVRAAQGQDVFDALLAGLPDMQRQRLYPPLVAGFRRWLRRTGATWAAPPEDALLLAPNVAVEVKPELGLVVKGVPHLVKLYCRREPLERARVEMTCAIVAAALQPPAGTVVGLLDVREGKLHTGGSPATRQRCARVALAEGGAYLALRRQAA